MAQANIGRTQPPWSGAASLRRIASDFLKFTQSYSQHFNVAHHNVSDNARAYTTGLVAKALRKNMERMEEYVEDCEYESLQQFLSDSPWCHEGLNKHIAGDVNDLLGDPDGVLAVDESGFAKKGRMSVGVARQWNGREGKTDNCQVGVYAALSDGVHASIVDFRLYLPKEWTEDKDRCLRAKIPEEKCKFKTKPELAVEMVDTALANGLLFLWVAMDAFCGQVPQCVRSIDRRGLNFVADVHRNQIVYMLKQRLLHQQDVALLSCQDIVELLNHYLPRTDLTEEAVLANLKRRHRARQRDIDSAYRRQQNRCANSQ